MVRRGARSRGCDNCREQKRKCDESYPVCGQCLTTNKACSGPVTGRFFVNSDVNTMRRDVAIQPDKTKHKPHQKEVALKQETPLQTPLRRCHRSKEEYLSLSMNDGLFLGPSYEIQAVSNLVYYYTQSARDSRGKKPWLLQLPNTIRSTRLRRIRAPLLAPSLMLLATQSQKQSIFKEALKWYDRGLNHIRTTLNSAGTIPNNELHSLVPATLLMSFFEAVSSTLDSGYEQHILGATTLLEAKGPHTFASSEFHGLFLAVRGHAIPVSLMTGRTTCLGQEPWLTIPFAYTRKSPLDRINDCLLATIDCVPWLETVISEMSDENIPALDQQSISRLSGLMCDLQEIWSRISHWEIPRASDDFERNQLSAECIYTYTNEYQANTIAMHGLAQLVLLLLNRQTCSGFTPSRMHMSKDAVSKMIVQTSASILSVATYLSTFKIGCAYLRMIIPLQLVAQHSPRGLQRDCAIHILEQWFVETPLKGLTRKALQKIYLHNRKSTFRLPQEGSHPDGRASDAEVRLPRKRCDWMANNTVDPFISYQKLIKKTD